MDRVTDIQTRQDCIRVLNLQKEYKSFFGAPVQAVNNISFGLDYGECFALIGVNGAGKSTTFKALTKDVLPTSGEITINGFNMQKQFGDIRKIIGYCPQYDPIFPTLTVAETIKYFGQIKGIKETQIKNAVD